MRPLTVLVDIVMGFAASITFGRWTTAGTGSFVGRLKTCLMAVVGLWRRPVCLVPEAPAWARSCEF
jgi:hypothetical protein